MALPGIEFHFNVPDRLVYACRLLRKAVANGACVQVVGDAAAVAQLDRLLWTFAPQSFVPHCWASAPSDLQAHTPIVLWREPADMNLARLPRPPQVLLNLGPHVPPVFDDFSRMIELVDGQPDVRQAARERWRHYQQAGYALRRHDYLTTAAAS